MILLYITKEPGKRSKKIRASQKPLLLQPKTRFGQDNNGTIQGLRLYSAGEQRETRRKHTGKEDDTLFRGLNSSTADWKAEANEGSARGLGRRRRRSRRRSRPARTTSSPPRRRVGDVRERRLAKFRQNVARFRLYRHRFLQVNTRFAAFFKIYKIIKLKFLKFGTILQILRHLQIFC